MVFVLLYSNTILVTLSRLKVISLTKDLKVINHRSSTNEKEVTEKQDYETESKMPLMYIKKKLARCKIFMKYQFLFSFLYFYIYQ